MPDKIYFNGFDGDTGRRLIPPCAPQALFESLPDHRPRAGHRKLAEGQVAGDLKDVGWGVLWPEGVDAERQAALQPLIEHRSRQMGRQCVELEVFIDESSSEFRERHAVGPGTLDTEALPYHLLIVASPEEISFDFQSALAVPHSVGRLHFDAIADFEAYVAAVLQFETTVETRRSRATLLGVSHPDDSLTASSVEHLVKGLDGRIHRDNPAWELHTFLRQAATKAQFLRCLEPDSLPSVLFTASHGLGFDSGSQRQARRQGALLCADYPGPVRWAPGTPIPDDFLLGADDLGADLDLSGLISFQFACYSVGTREDEIYALHSPEIKAEKPFLSPLPQRMLAQGALAVIGHVGVTLEESYLWYSAGPQINTFKNVLQAIMSGVPVGHAMDHIQSRHAELAAEITLRAKQAMRGAEEIDVLGHLHAWAAHEDTRHFMLLGDPAVRLGA